MSCLHCGNTGSVPTGVANREKWAAFDPLEGEAAELIRSIRDRLIASAGAAAGKRVLDVGAGTGLIAREMQRRAHHGGAVVAMDISEGALRTLVHAAGCPSEHTRLRPPALAS